MSKPAYRAKSSLDSKKKISTFGVLKLGHDEIKSCPIIRPKRNLSDLVINETKDKSGHVVKERSGSFDDYIKERIVHCEKRSEESGVDANKIDDYHEDDYYEDDYYEDHPSDEGYDSFEEEEYYAHEHIEKADAHPTTVRTGGGGKKIPFHSGRGTRAKEANIAKGTVLLPNGNILIK